MAQGYHNDGARTAERFIGDPFGGDDRLYRTGDLVNRGDDGRLYFHGRVDRQLKIRGHRVEPAEIETVLLQHPGVKTLHEFTRGAIGYGPLCCDDVLRTGQQKGATQAQHALTTKIAAD